MGAHVQTKGRSAQMLPIVGFSSQGRIAGFSQALLNMMALIRILSARLQILAIHIDHENHPQIRQGINQPMKFSHGCINDSGLSCRDALRPLSLALAMNRDLDLMSGWSATLPKLSLQDTCGRQLQLGHQILDKSRMARQAFD